jgi:DNA-binding Lrp family transcriptional regulator
VEGEVTQSAMLDELRKALDIPTVVDDPEAYTKKELAKLWGLADSTVGRRVNDAVEAGLVEEVYVYRPRKSGYPLMVKAYRMRKDEA